MDLSVLSTITIKVNISCCEACPRKLTNLLSNTDDVASFDIDKDKGLVTIKGAVNPQNLVTKIAKALDKKKTKLEIYELPKKKSEETKEKHASKKEDHSDIIEHIKGHGLGHEEKHSTHGDHGLMMDLHSTHNHENFHHFGPPPPNPHYPHPQGPAHHRRHEGFFPEMHGRHSMQHFEPVHHGMAPGHQYGLTPPHQYGMAPANQCSMAPCHQYGMMPAHQYGYQCTGGFCGPPTVSGMRQPMVPYGYYGERERQMPATNSVCTYFSDENAAGCAIM